MSDQGGIKDGINDEDRLRGYVEVWWQAIDSFTQLLEGLPDDAWGNPTDLPGWTVQDVAAHTAHLEGGLVGVPHDQVDIGEPAHLRGGMMSTYIEQGVVGRKDHSPDELIREIRESATKRHTQLLADPPSDATAAADGFAALVGWSWERLLRNRPLDVWMHDQDVRRAVDQPGGMDSPAAQHAADYLLESMSLVVGKKVAPPAGTTVLFKVAGSTPYAVSVGEDGRARPLDSTDGAPDVTVSMSRQDFIVAAGGRREPADVSVEGDQDLGTSIVANLAVTP